jgi:hypothetical protein
MKRSTWIAAAVAVMSLTLTVESATAQYYHQRPQRHYGGGGGGNNNMNALIAGIVGFTVGMAVVSASTQNAMQESFYRMHDLGIEDGYRSEFRGDTHWGYHEAVNQGRTNRYDRCRQIQKVVFDYSGKPVREYQNLPPRCICLNERGSWVPVNEGEYIPRRPERRPYGSVRVIVRQDEGPMYRPYYGRPTAPIAVARPYYAPVARPSYGPVVAPAYGGSRTPHIAGPAAGRPVHRPSGGYAPPVMPYQGAPGVIR